MNEIIKEKGKVEYCINLDWLEFTATGIIPQLEIDIHNIEIKEAYELSDRITIHRNRKFRNPNFNYCFDVYFNGDKVCYLFLHQALNSRFSTNNSVRIHVYNNELYTQGLGEKLNIVLHDLNLVFRDYYKLHIAIDGSGLIKKHNRYSKSLEYKRNSKITHQPTFNELTKDFDRSILGSFQSEKQISFYPKGQVLMIESKSYINDFWEMNGLIPAEECIDRCELRMSDKLLQGLTKDFTKLETPVYLASIFKRETKRCLEFKRILHPEERISIIDWEKFKTIELKKRNENYEKGTLAHFKTTLRTILEHYLETKNEEALELLCDISDHNQMNDWVYKVHEKWFLNLRIK